MANPHTIAFIVGLSFSILVAYCLTRDEPYIIALGFAYTLGYAIGRTFSDTQTPQ